MTKPTTAKLTTTQRLVLASACAHADGLATRPPQLRGAQAAKALAALVEAGLVREMRAKAEMPVWRHDEQGRPMAVRILKPGRTAVADVPLPTSTCAASSADAVETEQPGAKASGAANGSAPAGSASVPDGAASTPPGSKRTLILALMRREGGATMSELTAATGWLPHTTRAALTGLRKTGIAVALAKGVSGAASTYMVDAPATAVAA